MKKLQNDTRVRISLRMPLSGVQVLTMTASAWNEMSAAFSAASAREESLGCNQIAKDYREIADRIFYVLDARGYYDDVRSK